MNVRMCNIGLEYMKSKLDTVVKSLGPKMRERVIQFRKCVDYPTQGDEYFCMCDYSTPVAFASVNPKHGPFPYVHSLVSILPGHHAGRTMIECIHDHYRKPIWMQCRPNGDGTEIDPYTVNVDLLHKFYLKDCKTILGEIIMQDSIWDCQANFFYTMDIKPDQYRRLFEFITENYTVSREEDNRVNDNGKDLADSVRVAVRATIDKFVGRTLSVETKDEMFEEIRKLFFKNN